jgi:hypothetical protein
MRAFRRRQFAALAALTALEVVRRPVVALLALSAVLLTALTPLLTLHAFGEDGRLARDSGLAVHCVFGLMTAGYGAATLADARRRGTAAAVLSKPVGRTAFFLARYAGVALVLAAFSCNATWATLLAARTAEQFTTGPGIAGPVTDWQTGILLAAAPFAALAAGGYLNYARRRAVGAAAFTTLCILLPLIAFAAGCFDRFGNPAPFAWRLDWRVVPAALLVTEAVLALGALAVALAARLDAIPVMLISGLVFLVGLAGIFPSWQPFWMADALSGGSRIAWGYAAWAGVYAALLAAGFLGLGTAAFRSAEVVSRAGDGNG